MKLYHPIIKNINKIKNIKLANGSSLTSLHFSSREPENTSSFQGISTRSFGAYWITMPDNSKVIFKTYDAKTSQNLRRNRIVNEVLCYYLARQVGMNCARYEPAHIGKKVGLISYNFLKQDETLMSLHEFLKIDRDFSDNLYDTMDAIYLYTKEGYTIDRQKVLEDLFSIIVFDTITMQSDRHANNVNFILNKNTGEIRVAPCFDNEFAFAIDVVTEMSRYNNEKCFQDINTLRDHYSLKAQTFNIFNENSQSLKVFPHNVKNICALAKANPYLESILNRTLENFNINEAINVVEKIGYTIPEEYKTYLKYVCESNIEEIKKQLQCVEKDDIENMNDTINVR